MRCRDTRNYPKSRLQFAAGGAVDPTALAPFPGGPPPLRPAPVLPLTVAETMPRRVDAAAPAPTSGMPGGGPGGLALWRPGAFGESRAKAQARGKPL